MKVLYLIITIAIITFTILFLIKVTDQEETAKEKEEKEEGCPELAALQEACSDTVTVRKTTNPYVGNMGSEEAMTHMKERQALFLPESMFDPSTLKFLHRSEYYHEKLPQVEFRFYSGEGEDRIPVYPLKVFISLAKGRILPNTSGAFRLQAIDSLPGPIDMYGTYDASAIRLFLTEREDPFVTKHNDRNIALLMLLSNEEYILRARMKSGNCDMVSRTHTIRSPKISSPDDLYVYEIDVSRDGDYPSHRSRKRFTVNIAQEYLNDVNSVYIKCPLDSADGFGTVRAVEEKPGKFVLRQSSNYKGGSVFVYGEDRDRILFYAQIGEKLHLDLPEEACHNHLQEDYFNYKIITPLPSSLDTETIGFRSLGLFKEKTDGHYYPLFRSYNLEVSETQISANIRAPEGEFYGVIRVFYKEEMTSKFLLLDKIEFKPDSPVIEIDSYPTLDDWFGHG